jgi:hypothetical protein
VDDGAYWWTVADCSFSFHRDGIID